MALSKTPSSDTIPVVEWHRFDHDDRENTRPPHEDLVWVVDKFAGNQVTLGVFDGHTMITYWGSDDCSISHWALIDYPEAPAGKDLDAES